MAGTPPASRVTQTTGETKVVGVRSFAPGFRAAGPPIRYRRSPAQEPWRRPRLPFRPRVLFGPRHPQPVQRTHGKAFTCTDRCRKWMGPRPAGVRPPFGFCLEAVYALFEGRRSARLVTLRTSGWPWIPSTVWPLSAGATRSTQLSAARTQLPDQQSYLMPVAVLVTRIAYSRCDLTHLAAGSGSWADRTVCERPAGRCRYGAKPFSF